MIPGLRSSDCKTPAARWVRRVVLVAAVLLGGAGLLWTMLRGMAVKAGGNELFMAKTQLRMLGLNLEAFRMLRGDYPSEVEGLGVLVSERAGRMKYGRGSADKMLVDPWGQGVVYRRPGVLHPGGYDLIIVGPDGVLGSEDDLVNP